MFGYVKGKIKLSRHNTVLVLTEGGVGLSVNTGLLHLEEGEVAELYLHTDVKQDQISLWGFRGLSELRLFEQLLTVPGVGAKTAMGLISALGAGGLVEALSASDYKKLKAPGVGEKTAKRIVIELGGKVEGIGASELPGDSDTGGVGSVTKEEAVSALVSLGYSRGDIVNAMRKLPVEEYESVERLVKSLLRIL